MSTRLQQSPHRPPLVQIKQKRFRYLTCKYVYPLVRNKLDPNNSSELSRVPFLTAPYYHDDDTYNVYLTYMSEKKAVQMIDSIKSYYNINCDYIKMLREDMEHLSNVINIPLVIIRSYNPESNVYELSYFKKLKNNLLK